jgi:hypothetical protein
LNPARRISLYLLIGVVSALTLHARAQTGANKTYEIDVDASKQWVDTKVDLRAGARLHITATGTISYPQGGSMGPDG